MSENYFPGIGLFNYLRSEENTSSPSPEPAPEESNRDPDIIYAEPNG